MPNKSYINAFNRIARLTDQRLALLERKPCLMDMVDQVAIRSLTLKKQTINLEIAALRGVFRLTTRKDRVVTWPEAITPLDWLVRPDDADYHAFCEAMITNRRNILDTALDVLNENAICLREKGYGGSLAEAQQILSETLQGDPGRVGQKDQRHISMRDLKAIDMDLSDHEPAAGIMALIKEDGEERLTADATCSLLRIFVNAIWLTGMRPREVWQCTLFYPETGLSQEEKIICKTAPSIAITNKLMRPFSGKPLKQLLRLCDVPWETSLREGVPCAILIKTAKQNNANPQAGLAYRVQGLASIARYDLRMLVLASCLRLLRLPENRQEVLQSTLVRRLKQITRDNERLSSLNLNLYALRHSFATRVKSVHSPEATAAMTGHSSRSSLFRYGERGVRHRGGRYSSWVPSPDTIQEEAIRQLWHKPDKLSPDKKIEGRVPT